MAKNYSNKENNRNAANKMHQKTDIHHTQMNRTETVKTAEMQIRQHQKTAIETARIPAKT